MPDLLDDPFDTFWSLYPRRKESPVIEGKKKAREKLDAAIKSGVTWHEVIEGVKAYALCDRVRLGYVKMPVTWINNDCWEDEYEIPQTSEEILAAKPLSERTLEEWWEILGVKDNCFMRDFLPRNWRSSDGPPPGQQGCMVPDEIMVECDWRKYGT